MTENTPPEEPAEPFEASADADTAAEDAAFEGLNVLRAAALAETGPDARGGLDDVADDLAEIGFDRAYVFGERFGRETPDDEAAFALARRPRPELWRALNDTGGEEYRVAFLLAVLGSALERESAAAAAALWRIGNESPPIPGGWEEYGFWFDSWIERVMSELPPGPPTFPGSVWADAEDDELTRWNPVAWQEFHSAVLATEPPAPLDLIIATTLAGARLRQAIRSSDPVTRSFAFAVLVRASEAAGPPPEAFAATEADVSLLVHGTWGWKGSWWRPKSAFHDFILANHRSDLFALGTKFSWSGALSRRQRVIAARDLVDWALTVAPAGLHTVFAHSYGAEVVARAMHSGTAVDEVVLLSAPVNSHLVGAIPAARRVVDVRLRLDPVLALIPGARQRMPTAPNVTPVILNGWRINHASTHDPRVWLAEDIATRAGLGAT